MIKYLEEKKLFIIETQNTTYAFALNNKEVPLHIYYGAKLTFPEELVLLHRDDNERFCNYIFEYPQEYVSFCRGVYDEESIKVRYDDGVSDCELSYKSHKLEKNTLTLTLSDETYSFEVDLLYVVFDKLDLIERRAILKNHGKRLTVENAASANIYLPSCKDYNALTYSGSWGREYTPNIKKIPEGKIVIETRRGTASGPHHMPNFAVYDAANPISEDSGSLYFGMLKYSGNFRTVFEKNHACTVKITAGINFFDTSFILECGESFETPSVLLGYTEDGFSRMREIIYDLEYDDLSSADNIKKPFPIIYNSWYPYEFDIDEAKILSLMERAKGVGAELFVIDDGWMPGRSSDKRGLGDWYEDTDRFPRGLKYLSDMAHRKGLLFGLWVEPEMLNENSLLFREHPDWILRYKTRETSKIRHQMVLNLSLDEVYCFAEQTMDRIIEVYSLDYLKWDMNRYIAETDTMPDFQIRYTANVMRLYRHLRKKYPNLLIENCAHGGARADFGLFEFCDRINRSDNCDPIDVLSLHDNFTDWYLPRYAGGAGNISTSPNYVNKRISPIKYRTELGMTGSMSIGINLLKASEEELAFIKQSIEYYKTIRPILHNSYVYKLSPEKGGKIVVWQYTERGRRDAVVFIFAHGLNYGERMARIKLKGLLPDSVYEVIGKRYRGDTLMKYGLEIEEPKGDYFSRVIEVREVR